jgi:hypothetical protein
MSRVALNAQVLAGNNGHETSFAFLVVHIHELRLQHAKGRSGIHGLNRQQLLSWGARYLLSDLGVGS